MALRAAEILRDRADPECASSHTLSSYWLTPGLELMIGTSSRAAEASSGCSRNLLCCPPGSPVSDVFLLQVVHKAVLDVAETGTEAAAATGTSVARTISVMKVNFNRPFLMIISDTDTQTSLFMAKVTNPKEN